MATAVVTLGVNLAIGINPALTLITLVDIGVRYGVLQIGDDLTVVEKMVDGKGYLVEIIGFHAQQCCEKAFKSVLSRSGIRHSYTHDLMALIDLMRDGSIDVPE